MLTIEHILAPAIAAQPPPLRCLTFNLLHGGVFSGLVGNAQALDRRLEITLAELRALHLDVIGVQEASTGRTRGNVAERLAKGLGFSFAYAPASFRLFANETLNGLASSVMNFTEGPAILSRFPIASWTAYDLPRCGRFTDPRVLLCADLETPGGLLQVCSTHLSGNLCQARGVVERLLSRRNELPLLLMGDFNAPENSPVINLFTRESGFVDTFRLMNPEHPGFTVWQSVSAARSTVFRRVDFLFLAPGSEFPGKVLSSRVVLDAPRQLPDGRHLWPSDHYGILTEIEALPTEK